MWICKAASPTTALPELSLAAALVSAALGDGVLLEPGVGMLVCVGLAGARVAVESPDCSASPCTNASPQANMQQMVLLDCLFWASTHVSSCVQLQVLCHFDFGFAVFRQTSNL